MHLIFLGSPGSGKGTQASVIATKNGWKHLSTGDMLREAVAQGTELGKTAQEYMQRGALVPDALVIDMLVERLRQPDAQVGFVLDGFPRNLAQAEALDAALGADEKIDLALFIDVPDEELIRRLSGRWLCRNCGAIYHEESSPPRVAGKCDRCGHDLYQRDDDKPETVRARLEMQRTPADLVAHYRKQGKLADVDGTKPVDDVTAAILRAIEAAK